MAFGDGHIGDYNPMSDFSMEQISSLPESIFVGEGPSGGSIALMLN